MCPRPPDRPGLLDWPDWPFVLKTYPAHEEGGERRWNVALTGFSGGKDRVEKMHAVEVERDADGRVRHVAGTAFDLDVDLVLLAIGFAGPVRDRLLGDLDPGYTRRGAILTQDGFATREPGVFVAGDAKLGASLIVWAIAEGRKAARQMDIYLMGENRLPA